MRYETKSMEELEAKAREIEEKYKIDDASLFASNASGIEIHIHDSVAKKEVSYITCHLLSSDKNDKIDTLHIHRLATDANYLETGLATYLMCRVIKYAEEHNLQHITVHAEANKQIIPQKKLEDFYRNFHFNVQSKKSEKPAENEIKFI